MTENSLQEYYYY